ncbi:MAG: hypothetical protein QWI36_01990 [Wolbachia endosymbiont of Tyrophagus putrescentiae]|nr:hypothetical protein [Wolbachia endosymbiont of Tyrophagus putrescentiae]
MLFTTQLCYAQNIILQSPSEIFGKAVDKKVALSTKHVEMIWVSCLNSKSCVHFLITFNPNDSPGFQLILSGKKFTDKLMEEAFLFEKKSNTWTYQYGNIENKKQKKIKFLTFMRPLVVSQAMPIKLSVSEISELVSNKNVVFYTGAGISALAVPEMNELMSQFGIPHNLNSVDKLTHIIKFIHKVIKEPDKIIIVISNFKEACFYGKPTPAHYAVRDIVLLKNWQLLTENIDLLHQRSGVEPLARIKRTDGIDFYWLKKNIKSKHLRQIDYIVTVGLNSDEAGFLALYKKYNPQGKIIAMNLIQPNYLNNDDILVLGDVQKNLPDLLIQARKRSITTKRCSVDANNFLGRKAL